MTALYFTLVFFLSGVLPPGLGGSPLSGRTLVEFDGFVRGVMTCRRVPNVGLTIVQGDRVVLAESYGYANIERQIKATAETKYCIGSISKSFTATVIAKVLTDRRDITWDTPLRDFLGNSVKFTDEIRNKIVNLRDLLSHKLGVPGYFQALLAGYPKNLTRSEFVQKIQFLQPTAPVRTKFIYNNYMFTVAGFVAERLSGRSWEDMVTEWIFKPLGMKNSGFVDKVDSFEGFTSPYVFYNGKHVLVSMDSVISVHPSGPAGSIFVSLHDIAQWLKLHMGVAFNATDLGIDPDMLQETYKPQMVKPALVIDLTKPNYPIDDVLVSYNMGWFSSIYRGYNRLWHSGGIGTFTSMINIFPKKKIGIFISLNGPMGKKASYAIKAITNMAADILLGEEPWLTPTTACSYPEPWTKSAGESFVKKPTAPGRELREYGGTYGHSAYGSFVVTVANSSTLSLTFGRFAQMALRPVGGNTFSARYVGPLWFYTDSEGGFGPLTVRFQADNDSSSINQLLFPMDGTTHVVRLVKDFQFTSRGPLRPTRETPVCCADKHRTGLSVVLSTLSVFLCSRIVPI